MSQLLEKLEEAINETERIALAAFSDPGRYNPETRTWDRTGTDDGVWTAGGGETYEASRVNGIGITIYDEGGHTEEQAIHIAHNDPKRVLRRVARDRKLLARHVPIDALDGPFCQDCSWPSLDIIEAWPCLEVRDLAEEHEIEVES